MSDRRKTDAERKAEASKRYRDRQKLLEDDGWRTVKGATAVDGTALQVLAVRGLVPRVATGDDSELLHAYGPLLDLLAGADFKRVETPSGAFGILCIRLPNHNAEAAGASSYDGALWTAITQTLESNSR